MLDLAVFAIYRDHWWTRSKTANRFGTKSNKIRSWLLLTLRLKWGQRLRLILRPWNKIAWFFFCYNQGSTLRVPRLPTECQLLERKLIFSLSSIFARGYQTWMHQSPEKKLSQCNFFIVSFCLLMIGKLQHFFAQQFSHKSGHFKRFLRISFYELWDFSERKM